MKKTIGFREVVLLTFFLLCLVSGAARGSDNTSVVLVVDTARTSGAIDLTRYALGQGGLSEQPMILDRADQIGQLHPRTIRLFVQEYFDLYPAHHKFHWTTLDRAIGQLASYDWLVFTSANGVRSFVERLDASAADLRALRAKICAIGPATRAAIEALHLKVDLMGREYVAEGLLEAFSAYDLAAQRVLLPRAAVARDLVPVELARRGAQVDVVEAYRTVTPENAGAQTAQLFGGGRKPDCIAFTSSSTVQNFVAVAGAEALAGVKVASIGPVTTATARQLGIAVDAEARIFTVNGLVEAVLGLYTETSLSNG